jgi:hypothetical protein
MLRLSSPTPATITTNQSTMMMNHMMTKTSSAAATTAAAAATATTSSSTNHNTGWDLTAFQAIMWDASMTTEQDQERWVNQGISMRETATIGRGGSHNQDDTTSSAFDDEAAGGGGTAAAAAAAAVAAAVAAAPPGSAERLEQLVHRDAGIPWGLMQQHGGPCGVLAAVQAELLRHLWWYDDNEHIISPGTALARAMAEILVRVATTPPAHEASATSSSSSSPLSSSSSLPPVVRIVVPNPDNPSWQHLLLTNLADVVNVQTFPQHHHQPADDGDDNVHTSTWQAAIQAFLLTQLPIFADVGGVLLFVMSIVATRSATILTHEFDDAIGTKLTGQFGHCAQELINLLLTGQAVSNVFDNTLSPSGDMVCRGVQIRPQIGYLSQLEALRYCEVGSYYKSPRVPIWVVGSTSHFTVLFGDGAALAESQSDLILEECRRAFKSMEGGEENGFIQVKQLGEILDKLKIDLGSDAEAKTQTLASSMEVGGGAGIILWDDFWKAAGRLMTGATVENVLGAGTSTDPIRIDNLTSSTAIIPHPTAANASMVVVETDEEMARRLDAEWSNHDDVIGGLSGLNALSSAAAVVAAGRTTSNDQDSNDAAMMQGVEPCSSPGMTDEEYARVLQAAYDFPSNASVGAVQGDTTVADDELSNTVAADPDGSNIEAENTLLFGDQPNPTGESDGRQTPMNMEIDGDFGGAEDSKPAAKTPKQRQRAHSFEEFGESFSLYHYNGLRGGVLTRFKVTRLSSQEAIGSSVALNRGGAASGGGSSGQDLEDVVRTKWPSCNVDWLGGRAPFID